MLLTVLMGVCLRIVLFYWLIVLYFTHIYKGVYYDKKNIPTKQKKKS